MNKENTPKYLYKYYPSKNWDFIAKKWTIRFTPVSELNDPFESMPISDNILSSFSVIRHIGRIKVISNLLIFSNGGIVPNAPWWVIFISKVCRISS